MLSWTTKIAHAWDPVFPICAPDNDDNEADDAVVHLKVKGGFIQSINLMRPTYIALLSLLHYITCHLADAFIQSDLQSCYIHTL